MKDNLFTFHKTVHGYRHIQEEIPCQDSSTSLEGANQYQIIAVADGHGDPACHRSNRGSRFAVEVAEKCLKDFASAILSGDMLFEHPRQRTECIQQLTNTIVSKWNGAVRNDLLSNEVTEDDFKEAGKYEQAYKKGERLEHLYGTTLIAALHVQNYLIFVHQGDGRCDVFYSDGSVDQPVPWDVRCQGSTTTSMCDKDVFTRIRSRVIDLNEKDVVACFIGSDGVEDSYYDNEESQQGTHRFYMDLLCKIQECGIDGFDSYLQEMLPNFSKSGSTDDVSVAGIVDIAKTSELTDVYRSKVSEYDHRESLRIGLEESRSKVVSMTRKHGILCERITREQFELESATATYNSVVETLARTRVARDGHAEIVEQAQGDLEEYQHDYQLASGELEGKYSRLTVAIQRFFEDISAGVSQKEADYRKLLEQLIDYDESIQKLEGEEKDLSSRISELEDRLSSSKTEFEEYDKQFQRYKEDVKRFESELASLNGGI